MIAREERDPLRPRHDVAEPLVDHISGDDLPPGAEVVRARAASRSTKRKAIGSAAVEKVAKREFEKTASMAIQAHTRASGQRQQARRDFR